MPAPVWNFTPSRGDGTPEPGFDRRSRYPLLPDETPNWSPVAQYAWPRATEPGGAMIRKSRSGMNDFFTYPQGTGPREFYQQQIDRGAAPLPPVGSAVAASGAGPVIVPEPMDESFLYASRVPAAEGSMAWERSQAPWELPGSAQAPLPPAQATAAIAQARDNARAKSEAKALEAAQAAKIAADNAVRAAVAGAPVVAATNASTAQAAANVAAGVAMSPLAQQAAAAAQSEATRAVAAANVAAQNGKRNGNGNGNGNMNDWMELSGIGFFDTPLGGGVKLWHVGLGLGLAGLGWFAYRQLSQSK